MPRHSSERDAASGRPVGRIAAFVAMIAVVLAAVPFLAPLTASAVDPAPARSALLNSGGFPTWYQDVHGVRVEPCLDPALVNCLAPLPGPTYDGGTLSFPGNYPDEFFYSAVDSEPVIVNDCVSPTPVANPGISVHLALEAAFINGDPAAGDQMVFGRIRIVAKAGSGLCGDTWYTFNTPYGPVTTKTEPDGTIAGGIAAANTIDIGCFPSPISPCNFNDVFTAPVLEVGLLQQAAGAPAGYLGDGSFSPVVGGKDGYNQFEVVKWNSGTPSPAGLGTACVTDCTTLGSTANFSVLAKLAGPIAGSTESLDFGGQVVGTESDARSITLTNLGSGVLGMDASSIDDIQVNGASFSLDTTSCSVGTVTTPDAPTPMLRDDSCAVTVKFGPSVLGATSGTLDVFANGSATPVLSVALKGTGITATDAPGIETDPLNVVFDDTRFRTVSDIIDVTVHNTGTAPLLATPSIDVTADSNSFVIASNSCVTGYVPADATCTIGVRFIPHHPGMYSEMLRIANNTGTDALITLAGNSGGGTAAVSTTVDPVNTFPDWYQDEFGTRVGQCADPNNPLCIAAPVTGPLSFPDNYPDEWFYYMIQSAPLDISDPACNAAPGPVMVEIAAEAAFLGPVAANEGITFGRLRIVSRGGLCPDKQYVFTHPYGRTIISTDDAGDVKPAAGTTDVGCLGAPCDYTQALSAVVFERFMEQTVRPGGYLGDPVNPSTVTGAPWPRTGTPMNRFTVETLDGELIGETDQFGVSGRLVGPMVASPAAYTFPSVQAGVTADHKDTTVTFTNDGLGPVTLEATPVSIDGANISDFTVTGGTCAPGLVIAAGSNCTVDVSYVPMGTGERSGELTLHHSGKNSPLAVPLDGIGLAPVGSAAFSTNVSAVKFIDLHQGELSESQVITVSNVGGQAPLEVGVPTITAGQPFQLTGTTCDVLVQVGEKCTISVRFAPGVAGAFHAVVTVPGGTFGGAPLPSLSISLDGNGVNIAPAVSAVSNSGGFPSWIGDNNGVRLEQCLQNDGSCVLLPDGSFNPANPVSFPTNYPLESFYSIADSEPLLYAGQACGDGTTSAGGQALLRVATEAAFTTPVPSNGGQNWFNRIRITADGLCANTTYQFVTPYGVKSLTTDGAGAVKAKAGTVDNTNIVASDPAQHAVLQWDPNVAPYAAPGLIGNPSIFHTVVGSVFRPAGETEPVNYFGIVGAGGTVARTDKFAVAGRLAGPVVSNVASRDLGHVQVGAANTADIVITNIGSAAVSTIAPTVTGTGFSRIAAPVGVGLLPDCTVPGLTLQRDQACVVRVRFNPLAGGSFTGQLTVGHDGLRSPVTVALTGTGVPNGTPIVTVAPPLGGSTAFGSVTVGSPAQITLAVKNSGTAPLWVTTLGKTGTDAAQFTVTNSSCSLGNAIPTPVLVPGNVCNITVTFNPTSSGNKTANITVAATDAQNAIGHVPVIIPVASIAVTGTGIQGTITPSPTSVSLTGKAGTVSTVKVLLTNSGAAPFTISNVSLLSTAGGLSVSTAAQIGNTCTNVAVKKNCQITVSYLPTGAVGSTVTTTLRILSNASNSTLNIPVTATRQK